MLTYFKQLDQILRGDATRLSSLTDAEIKIPIGGLSLAVLSLGVLYGLCAGSFAMIQTAGQAYMQFIASAIKVPMLFFLTLVVTFPSLYVFNALIGTRLSVLSAVRVLIAALGVMLAVLASLGPIVVFFGLSTKNYSFMVLLNVATSTVAGVLGLKFLLQTLDRLVIVQEDTAPPSNESGQTKDDPPGEQASQDKPTEPAAALDRARESTTIKAASSHRMPDHAVRVVSRAREQFLHCRRAGTGQPVLAVRDSPHAKFYLLRHADDTTPGRQCASSQTLGGSGRPSGRYADPTGSTGSRVRIRIRSGDGQFRRRFWRATVAGCLFGHKGAAASDGYIRTESAEFLCG